ncbi:MAG: site-2 protease family protein [Tissierellia bacterium]|nr:site-2 protease family protein [Tissierellia bacterium]
MDSLLDILTRIPALLLAVVGHELGHGWVAYLMGDSTAKRDGRLSLNPLHHIDPLGLLSMIIFRFGWAKAVPINPNAFRNRKLGILLVSLAGVGVNFLLALVFSPLLVWSLDQPGLLSDFLIQLVWYNVMLGVFNLVPLPPLDGSKVLASFLPRKWEFYFYQYERYFYFLLVLAVFSGFISGFISPLIVGIIDHLLTFGAWVVL